LERGRAIGEASQRLAPRDCASRSTSAIASTALNPDSVSPLSAAFMDPVSASDLNTVAGKVDELIGALKRNP
jgi:hypothetical protein